MFNFSGSEIVFLLLLALIILGPDKLPDAIKRFGKTYAEFKKVSNGFQSELRSALDEPMREMRSTADILKNATNFDSITDTKPVSGSMAAATPAPLAAPAPDPAPVAAAPAPTPEPINPYAVVSSESAPSVTSPVETAPLTSDTSQVAPAAAAPDREQEEPTA